LVALFPGLAILNNAYTKRVEKPASAAQARVGDVSSVAHESFEGARKNAWEAVFSLVKKIPRGRVMTYGQVATTIASRLSPRAVGWARRDWAGGRPGPMRPSTMRATSRPPAARSCLA
jgi:hypothetical protein